MKKRVGILTSGGDCPGLNATIRGAAKALYQRFGDEVEIVGIQNGYDGLIKGEWREMQQYEFSGILTVGGTIPVSYTHLENTRELVVQSVEQARAQVMADGSILPSNKNREIVALLHRWNIFKIKDSVPLTAQALDISPNTVYLHLRNVRQEEDA